MATKVVDVEKHIDEVCIECPIDQRDTDRICEKCPVRLLSEKASGYLTENRPERIAHWCDALGIEPEDIIL